MTAKSTFDLCSGLNGELRKAPRRKSRGGSVSRLRRRTQRGSAYWWRYQSGPQDEREQLTGLFFGLRLVGGRRAPAEGVSSKDRDRETPGRRVSAGLKKTTQGQGGSSPRKPGSNRARRHAQVKRVAKHLRLPVEEKTKFLRQLGERITSRWAAESVVAEPFKGGRPAQGKRVFAAGLLLQAFVEPVERAAAVKRLQPGFLKRNRVAWILNTTYYVPVDRSMIPGNLLLPLYAFRRLFHNLWKTTGRAVVVPGDASTLPRPPKSDRLSEWDDGPSYWAAPSSSNGYVGGLIGWDVK